MADADLLERDDTIDEQGGEERERWVDQAAKVFFDEVVSIIADRLGRQDTSEREMMWMLDGVPMSVIELAADLLGVTVRGGVWRLRRRA